MSAIGVGSYVNVKKKRRKGKADSQGGNAFVINAADAHDSHFDVRYVIDNRLSPNVKVSRLLPADGDLLYCLHSDKKQ
jgi:hypothetical protein